MNVMYGPIYILKFFLSSDFKENYFKMTSVILLK
jgi:hypothetical protein